MSVSNLFLGNKTGCRVFYEEDVIFESTLQSGLYQNGVLVKTWAQIKQEYSSAFNSTGTTISANNGVSYFTDLEGTLVIDGSVSNIYDSAFYNCNGIINVVFNQSNSTTLTIKSNVFSNCENLQKVFMHSQVILADRRIFNECRSLKFVDMSKCSMITSIPVNCFMLCTSLQEVKLSPSTTQLMSGSFDRCSSLKKINTSNITSFDYCCLRNCSLENIDLTNAVMIGEQALSGCSLLKNIVLTNNLISIGSRAFTGINFDVLIIPTSVTTIGESAFLYDYGKIVFQTNNPPVNTAQNAFYDFYGEVRVPVGSLDNYFYHESFIDFTGYLADRDAGLYQNGSLVMSWDDLCKNYSSHFKATSIGTGNIPTQSIIDLLNGELYIPSSILTIKRNCFYNCVNLEKIVLSRRIEEIPQSCFYYCSSLSELLLSPRISGIGSSCFSHSGITKIVFCSRFDIEESSNFYGCANLVEVIGFENAKKLTSSCFGDCTNLSSITLPNYLEGSTVVSSGIFYGCNSLTGNIKIPQNVDEIGSSAFYNCKNITKIEIPNTVTKIGAYAFVNCEKTELVFDFSNVKELGNYAFWNCYELNQSLYLDNLESIGQTCFSGCKKLKYVNLSNSVITIIPNTCFNGCKELEYVFFPSALDEIGDYAFQGASVENFVFNYSRRRTPVIFGKGCFYNCSFGELIIDFPVTLNERSFASSKGQKLTFGTSIYEFPRECFFSAKIDTISFYTPPTYSTDIYIREQCFENFNCTSNFVMPTEKVVHIESYAFRYLKAPLFDFNNAFTSPMFMVDMSSSTNVFGENSAMYLRSIIVRSTYPSSIHTYSGFESFLSRLSNIYVPSSAVNSYKTTSPWSLYSSKIQAIPTT